MALGAPEIILLALLGVVAAVVVTVMLVRRAARTASQVVPPTATRPSIGGEGPRGYPEPQGYVRSQPSPVERRPQA